MEGCQGFKRSRLDWSFFCFHSGILYCCWVCLKCVCVGGGGPEGKHWISRNKTFQYGIVAKLFYLPKGRLTKLTGEAVIPDWVRGVSPDHSVFFLVSSLNECWPGKQARGFPLFRLPSTWVIPCHLSLTFGLSSPLSFGPEDWAGQFHFGSSQQLPLMSLIYCVLGQHSSKVWGGTKLSPKQPAHQTRFQLTVLLFLQPQGRGDCSGSLVFSERKLFIQELSGKEVFKNYVLAQQRSPACWEETL